MLKVKDNDGIESELISKTVMIRNRAPTAIAGDDVYSYPHIFVQFNGQGTDQDGEVSLFEWDFDGNGIYDWSSTENGLTTFIYNNPKNYTAVLRVTDDDGVQDTDSIMIFVKSNLTDDVNLTNGDEDGFIPGFSLVSTTIGIIGVTIITISRRKRKLVLST